MDTFTFISNYRLSDRVSIERKCIDYCEGSSVKKREESYMLYSTGLSIELIHLSKDEMYKLFCKMSEFNLSRQ